MARRNRRRPVQRLIQLARGRGPKGLLNQATIQIAEEVNGEGLRKQLQYLQNNIGSVRTEFLVKDLLSQEEDITRLIGSALQPECFGLLLQIVYDLKMKEAHALAHSRIRKVLRFLVDKIGIERTTKLIESANNGRKTEEI